MTIIPEQLPLTIYKGVKFYQEFQLLQDDESVVSLVGKTLKCTIKESFNAATVLHNLTEANGGVVKVDAANGIFAILITSDLTNVSVSKGVYDIISINDDYPTIETELLIRGAIVYINGVTPQ